MIDLRFPRIQGDEREQLSQIKNYLYQLTEQLQREANNSSGFATNYVVQQIPSYSSSSLQTTENTDDEPKTDVADIKIGKNLKAKGWYKIGTLSGEMCAVATLTIGGMFMYNQVSPSMVDIATHYDNARAFLRMPSLNEGQIAKIGVVKESPQVYGVYAYYNNTTENPVRINIHTHMGTFTSSDFIVSSVTDSNMIAVVALKA